MSATTEWLQIGLLIMNAGLIYKYLGETTKMRKAAENQVKESQEQVRASHSQTKAAYEQVAAIREQIAIALDQSEALIRPALTISAKSTYTVVNVGNGPALNLQLLKGRNQDMRIATMAESNFGHTLKGSFVEPGESHAKDTNEKFDSVGQMRGEDVQLIYESLSGKKYASIVEFDGRGNPSKTRFSASEQRGFSA